MAHSVTLLDRKGYLVKASQNAEVVHLLEDPESLNARQRQRRAWLVGQQRAPAGYAAWVALKQQLVAQSVTSGIAVPVRVVVPEQPDVSNS